MSAHFVLKYENWPMKTNVKTADRSGMTLVEVLVTVAITSIVLAGVITSVMMGNQVNYANAQRVTAFGLCKEWYEQMRTTTFTNITTTTFPEEEIELTHLGGLSRLPLHGVRSCTIREIASPTRKTVNIQVRWTYQGKELSESLDGTVYKRR